MLKSLALIVALLFAISIPAAAQSWPPEIKNLKVFPEETETKDVLDSMRHFTMALGVRCQHCHVGEEGQPLSDFDFASDEKEQKQLARRMMQMTAAINGNHLAELERSAVLEVQCVTCHRGTQRPERLDALLVRTVEAEGLDAALKRYGELRAEFYGSGSYDFGESTLVRAGEKLMEAGRFAEAASLLEDNLERHPDSDWTAGTLASAYEQSDRKAEALAIWKRMLEKNPDNRRIKAQIERLQTSG